MIDTALHIVKGAAVKVLETPLTVSVSYRNATEGRLVLTYTDQQPPAQGKIQQIEQLANEIVEKKIKVC